MLLPTMHRKKQESRSMCLESHDTRLLVYLAAVQSRAARCRVEAAEAAGKARDEQLEMLHAVRQYMAQQQARLIAKQGINVV